MPCTKPQWPADTQFSEGHQGQTEGAVAVVADGEISALAQNDKQHPRAQESLLKHACMKCHRNPKLIGKLPQ